MLGALGRGYGLLIVAAFAIGFAPPGADTVVGVQGRYFLISFCLGVLALAGARIWPVHRVAVVAPVLASLLGGVVALAFLVEAIPRLYAMRN